MSNQIESYARQNLEMELSETDSFTSDRYIQFHKFMPPTVHRVLDVGCSTGRGGRVLKGLRSDCKLAGLDVVEERLQKLPDCYDEHVLSLSTNISEDDSSFDCVIAGEFLEHLYPSDVDQTLCEFQRILGIGGRLLLTTPNPAYLRNKIRGATVYGTSHLTQHWPRVLRTRLLMHGFSRVKIYGSGRVSRHIGCRFPLLFLYGSYLITADKI